MTKEKKLNDLDYCYASWLLLKNLEELSYARNDQIRKYREQKNKKMTRTGFIIALIFPVILWVDLVFFSKGINKILFARESLTYFVMRLIALVFVTALLFFFIFFLVRVILNLKMFSATKNWLEKDLKVKLFQEIKEIDERVEETVYKSVFREQRIPENFLSPTFLMMIIRYFETGQAVIMKEALYALDLELKNTGYYNNLVTSDTLLKKEKDYLKDKETRLDIMIKEGENQ